MQHEERDLVRSIGADAVVDYTTTEDVTRSAGPDLIVEAVGNRSLSDWRRVLTPTGTLVLVGGGEGRWVGPMATPGKAILLSRFVRQRLRTLLAQLDNDDLLAIVELIEAGKVTPVIDRTYPLSEADEAIRYLEAGHAQGKVVITV